MQMVLRDAIHKVGYISGFVRRPTVTHMNSLPKRYPHFHYVMLVLFALVGFAGRVLTMPHYIETIDSYNFVRALDHYSVVDYSPHWPGYPVYIWIGSFVNRFVSDPVLALHLLSVAATSLTVFPLAALTVAWRRAYGTNWAVIR